MKFMIAFLLIFTSIFAQAKTKEKLVIGAENFEAFDKKGLSIFTGNVNMESAKDKLTSDKLEVYMTDSTKNGKKQKRVVLKYIATGNVNFEVFAQDKHYKGKGQKVIYKPKKLEYEIIGKGSIKEINENKTLFGESIILNQITGEAKVRGAKNKPVKFIMEIER
jgi:lipopolysaccharide export system protein LptA